PAVTKNNQGIFRLKREFYNGFTGKQSPLSVLCKYPLQTRHNNVAEATTRQPIFSVGGELVTLQKYAFILCKTIKWNYIPITNQSNPDSNAQSNYANKRKRQEELERIAEKFNSHPTSTQNLHRNSSQKPLPSGSSSKQNSYNTHTEEPIDKGKKLANYDTNININSECVYSNYDPNTPCETLPSTQESPEPSNFTE
ncbi:13005_t:CDS:2, partial [Gigaspora rosea]